MSNRYSIFLDNIKIGTTQLEKSDPPMGVVMGRIHAEIDTFNFEFIRDYCIKNNIVININDSEFKAIETRTILELKVFNSLSIEIVGQGNFLSGIQSEGFEITILGVPYPFFEEEFPKHFKKYDE